MEYYDYLEIPGATDIEIAEEEKAIGHSFPELLKEVLRTKQGFRPSKFKMRVNGGPIVRMQNFCCCRGKHDRNSYTIDANTDQVRTDCPVDLSHIVVFAICSPQTRLCLDYHQLTDGEPAVIFANLDFILPDDRAFKYVCKNFDEFMNLVRVNSFSD